MKYFEYLHYAIYDIAFDLVTMKCNELGKQGWELVTTTGNNGGFLIFKREIEKPESHEVMKPVVVEKPKKTKKNKWFMILGGIMIEYKSQFLNIFPEEKEKYRFVYNVVNVCEAKILDDF